MTNEMTPHPLKDAAVAVADAATATLLATFHLAVPFPFGANSFVRSFIHSFMEVIFTQKAETKKKVNVPGYVSVVVVVVVFNVAT